MVDQMPLSRLVVLGRNSKIWAILKSSPLLSDIQVIAIGHSELKDFKFHRGDNVWIFSYSKIMDENLEMFDVLALQLDISVVYVSSASTNVTALTRCYKYPVLKKLASDEAVRICSACVVNIGLFYKNVTTLPAGRTAVTSVEMLGFAMRSISMSPGRVVNLFELVDRPFNSRLERTLYQLYGLVLGFCGRFPCFTRPIDVVLRKLDMRWYGYLYLSNRLWSTTIL